MNWEKNLKEEHCYAQSLEDRPMGGKSRNAALLQRAKRGISPCYACLKPASDRFEVDGGKGGEATGILSSALLLQGLILLYYSLILQSAWTGKTGDDTMVLLSGGREIRQEGWKEDV